MKTKYAIIIWLVGVIIEFIVLIFKIQHYPFGTLISLILYFGMLLQFIGIIIFVYKLFKNPKIKEFLNY